MLSACVKQHAPPQLFAQHLYTRPLYLFEPLAWYDSVDAIQVFFTKGGRGEIEMAICEGQASCPSSATTGFLEENSSSCPTPFFSIMLSCVTKTAKSNNILASCQPTTVPGNWYSVTSNFLTHKVLPLLHSLVHYDLGLLWQVQFDPLCLWWSSVGSFTLQGGRSLEDLDDEGPSLGHHQQGPILTPKLTKLQAHHNILHITIITRRVRSALGE